MKLLVLDGNSILNRAFYGIRLLSTREGVFTNAIMGFMNILLKLKEQTAPDGVAAAFDLPAPTFRHQLYSGYKAGRKKMPEELASQLPLLKDLLPDYGVAVVELAGYEADDLLGTLAARCKEQGVECLLATGDRDSRVKLLQLRLQRGFGRLVLGVGRLLKRIPLGRGLDVRHILAPPYKSLNMMSADGDYTNTFP